MAISNFGIGGFDNADSSFQGLGNLVSTYNLGSGIPGCTDGTATNYNVNATWDDGSCTYGITGCTDPSAANYNASVTVDDGSCLYVGCMDSDYLEYDAIYNVSNPADCLTLTTYGCTVTTTALIGDGSGFSYPIYWNSDSGFTAPCDDTNGPGCFGSQTGTNCCCEPVIVGCTTPGDANYNSLANYQAQPGSSMECITNILGCTNPIADNYDPTANQDDGSCTYTVVYGCTDATADNYDPLATQEDGSCVYTVYGCTDPTASNYMGAPAANETQVDDLSCCIDGCMTAGYLEYDASYTCDDGSYCLTVSIAGCTDPLAANYDPYANVDDGSCSPCSPGIIGCMDPLAINYDPCAVVNNSASCTYGGCTDSTAYNYDASATVDDGSCTYVPSCTDTNGVTYTIGDDHPTLNATLFEFSYNEPGLMAIGDCGRMYVTKSTLSGSAGHNWGCDGISVASTGTTSGVLYGAEVQVAGRGSQNTQDMVSAGCGGAGTIIEYLGTDWPGFHLPSMQELVHVWQNVGPGNIHGLGNLTAITYGNSGDAGVWISEEADPPANLSYAKDIEWAGPGGGNITTDHKDQGAGYFGYTLGVLYEGNFGCTDPTDINNYDPTASWDDGSCGAPLAIGDAYQGGYIFHFNNGVDITDGGLIASYDQITPELIPVPLVSGIYDNYWGCEGELVSGASGILIGTGYQNTQDILAHQSVNGISCSATFNLSTLSAAQECDNYSITENGVTYDDWYLPSLNELQMFLTNLPIGFGYLITTISYWSSTQYDADSAYGANENSSIGAGEVAKTTNHFAVRAIRSF